MTAIFTKSREPARPGSIPDRLQMFTREVRFYTEIAPAVGVRVPAVFRAEARDGATVLELEDLSSWREGADPVAAARALASLHGRWVDRAEDTWSWLPGRTRLTSWVGCSMRAGPSCGGGPTARAWYDVSATPWWAR